MAPAAYQHGPRSGGCQRPDALVLHPVEALDAGIIMDRAIAPCAEPQGAATLHEAAPQVGHGLVQVGVHRPDEGHAALVRIEAVQATVGGDPDQARWIDDGGDVLKRFIGAGMRVDHPSMARYGVNDADLAPAYAIDRFAHGVLHIPGDGIVVPGFGDAYAWQGVHHVRSVVLRRDPKRMARDTSPQAVVT